LQAAAAPGKAQRRPAFRATLTQSSFLFFLLVCDQAASSTHAPSEGHDAQARTHSVSARAPVAPFLRHRVVGFLSTHSQVFVGASFRCQDFESRPRFVEQSGPSAPPAKAAVVVDAPTTAPAELASGFFQQCVFARGEVGAPKPTG
jgi:hypothetical protein